MAKIERTKNASRNAFFGILLKIYQILFPFVIRTVMIYYMGIQYLGLNSLFSSILQVLNLAELGVGSAIVFSMYKPIAEDDSDTICALMGLYRRYYRIIGSVIAVMGILLTPFIPYLIKSDIPHEINIYTLYLLNLAATVLSYWLFAYKQSIFIAHQRNDIISRVTIVINTLQYTAQIIVIVVLQYYYAYIIISLASQILINISVAYYASKIYPLYVPSGKLQDGTVQAINKRIKDFFTSKIGGIIVNSADTIVISAFLGLTVLAIYQNYFFIITSVIGIVTVIFNSCTAGVGNSIITETKDKNYNDLKKFTMLISWISCICSCCFLNLFQPFMKIWVGEELLLQYSAVICFTIYYYVYEINQLLNMYKDAAGIWHRDRFRPLITALSNLTLNLLMVQKWGIYGVLLSTVISMLFVGMPWLFHNLFSTVFDMGYLKEYLRRVLIYAAVSLLACAVSIAICSFVDFPGWLCFFIRLVICLLLSNMIYIWAFHNKDEFTQLINLFDTIIRRQGRRQKSKM